MSKIHKIGCFLVCIYILITISSCVGLDKKTIKLEDTVDFILDVESGREIRILQLTDTQIIDAGQSRYEDRINASSKISWATNTIESNCFNYIRDTIEMTNPDLIILTGDIIYGEFDDNGSSLKKLVKFMDSFKIPWAPVFGNHENESEMGVDWQCETIENAEYSYFKRGNVSGNSNYTIAIQQDDKLVRMIYMMDSNGCGSTDDISVKKSVGFAEDQINWFNETASNVEKYNNGKVPSFVCYHIPTVEFGDAVANSGYQSNPNENVLYTIGSAKMPAINDDFGTKGENYPGMHTVPGLLDMFKTHAVDGVFIGHCHKINTSVLYEGIRWTVGLKTGTYDSHTPNELGGTYIQVKEDGSFTVEHKYVKKYKIEPDKYSEIYSQNN